MEEEVRAVFTGVWIPVAVLDKPNLSPTDKLLYAHIESLGGASTTGCFASKEYLCKRLNIPDRTLRRSLRTLEESEMIYRAGFRRRVQVYRCTGKYLFVKNDTGQNGRSTPATMADDDRPQWPLESKEESKEKNQIIPSPSAPVLRKPKKVSAHTQEENELARELTELSQKLGGTWASYPAEIAAMYKLIAYSHQAAGAFWQDFLRTFFAKAWELRRRDKWMASNPYTPRFLLNQANKIAMTMKAHEEYDEKFLAMLTAGL